MLKTTVSSISVSLEVRGVRITLPALTSWPQLYLPLVWHGR